MLRHKLIIIITINLTLKAERIGDLGFTDFISSTCSASLAKPSPFPLKEKGPV